MITTSCPVVFANVLLNVGSNMAQSESTIRDCVISVTVTQRQTTISRQKGSVLEALLKGKRLKGEVGAVKKWKEVV